VPPELSSQLGLATTEFKARGMRITTHLHERDDEAFFVHRGGGVFTLGDRRMEIGQGDIVFIPKGVWHGFESSSENTLLVWAVSSSKYLELPRRFFLGTDDPSPAELERLYRLYGFREKEAVGCAAMGETSLLARARVRFFSVRDSCGRFVRYPATLAEAPEFVRRYGDQAWEPIAPTG
jgi:uncharacterized RmlC-like cupin family protein